jgi:hypothetical protein
MLRRSLMHWLFAVALLWGQAAAYAHTISHLTDSDPELPAHVCEQCLAQASLGCAATSAPPTIYLPASTYDWFIADVYPTPDPRLPAPRARAPPAPSEI